MAASAWAMTATGRTKLLDNSAFDIDSGTYKVALFTSSSNLGSASTTYAGVTNEVAAANGYSTGGVSVTMTLSGTTTVTVKFSSNPSYTASGGSIVARFAAVYEVSGNILLFCTLDSSPADVTTTTGNTLTIDGTTNGLFTLA